MLLLIISKPITFDSNQYSKSCCCSANLRHATDTTYLTFILRQIECPSERIRHRWGTLINRRIRRSTNRKRGELIVLNFNGVARIALSQRNNLLRLKSSGKNRLTAIPVQRHLVCRYLKQHTSVQTHLRWRYFCIY
jgi:hypothetical protein